MLEDYPILGLFEKTTKDFNERVWKLPLWGEYNKHLSSKIADLKKFNQTFFCLDPGPRNFNLIDLNQVSNFSPRRQLSNEILFGGLE